MTHLVGYFDIKVEVYSPFSRRSPVDIGGASFPSESSLRHLAEFSFRDARYDDQPYHHPATPILIHVLLHHAHTIVSDGSLCQCSPVTSVIHAQCQSRSVSITLSVNHPCALSSILSHAQSISSLWVTLRESLSASVSRTWPVINPLKYQSLSTPPVSFTHPY